MRLDGKKDIRSLKSTLSICNLVPIKPAFYLLSREIIKDVKPNTE